MATVSRRPCPELAPWIERIWASSPGARSGDTTYDNHPQGVLTERVLPTGTTHVVWREATTPLTLVTDLGQPQTILTSQVIVGGIRSAAYDKRVSEDAATVGIQLKPGGARVLIGVPAEEVAERHTCLETTWGRDATDVWEQLYATNEDERDGDALTQQQRLSARLHARVNTLEAFLLPRVRRLDIDRDRQRWLEYCAQGLERQVPLAQLAQETGISHRTLITRFRAGVGISPKVYARIRRFQRLIQTLLNPGDRCGSRPVARLASLAQLAVDAGYSDQAHLCRDFREFSGFAPTNYLRLAPLLPNHVRLPG